MLMGDAETSLLFELTVFIMQGCSPHGENKFRGRKVFKVKEENSLEGQRPSKFWNLCRTGPCSALLFAGCWEKASESPQAELQARSFANNTRRGFTGLWVRRPRGTDLGGDGRWFCVGLPSPVGVHLPETNSVSSLELKVRSWNKDVEKHRNLLPSGQCWKTSENASF